MALNLLSKLLRADEARPSRFHTLKGDLLAAYDYRDLVLSVADRLGPRREMPWLPRPVVRRMAKIIRPDWQVLEFGCGYGTLWLAGRCRLVSVESDEAWYRSIKAKLDARGLDARLEFRGRVDYAKIDGLFDLVIVDGIERRKCVENAIDHINAGGVLYLDNSDGMSSDYREAGDTLLEAATSRGWTLEVMRGYAPRQLAPSEGMWAVSSGRT